MLIQHMYDLCELYDGPIAALILILCACALVAWCEYDRRKR